MDALSGPAPLKDELKRVEPQDRLQDATSLRVRRRSKPARSCETTRSERFEVQAPRPETVATPWKSHTQLDDVDGGVRARARRIP